MTFAAAYLRSIRSNRYEYQNDGIHIYLPLDQILLSTLSKLKLRQKFTKCEKQMENNFQCRKEFTRFFILLIYEFLKS